MHFGLHICYHVALLIAGEYPLQQLEWDRKLWWVHLEALVAPAMGCALTGRPQAAEWFEKLHDYTWSRFPDPDYGERFGNLDRRGERLLDLKGGKWKGCLSSISNKMNAVMKVLTIIATVFIPLTFVEGDELICFGRLKNIRDKTSKNSQSNDADS